MSKQEFLARLREGLSGLPREDLEERLAFYGEMIDDRMEEGLTEEEAVAAVGTVEEIAAQAAAEASPATRAAKKAEPKRRLSASEIALLAILSPIWVSLGIAAFSVLLSLMISLWAVMISLWAVFVSLAAGAVCGVLSCVVFVLTGSAASGIATLAAGIACAGLSIFAFYGCRAATKGSAALTKKTAVGIQNLFGKKGEAK